ncbi:MAG: RrF2 family transcriptional regulator [Anaerolineae bacterium]|jgi:Rrf2 family cysteine metabolism transcriptional repressor|nr:Rrf2 family transcriptional regulator [Chloroflexota bacterium]
MKISTKGEYGIRALLELSWRYGEGYIQSSEIAAAREIPENYLYQLLISLRKAGIILSRRGPQGGHTLARAPEAVSLAEAVLALEGPLAVTACVQDDVIHDCLRSGFCPVRSVWEKVTRATQEILESTSFAQLVEEERARRKEQSPD